MHKTIYRHLVIPAFESAIKRRRTFRYWSELERSQWLSRDELERRQLESLKKLLHYAEATCPYYQNAWKDAQLRIDDIHSLADFQRWPIIERKTINAERVNLRSTKPGLRLIAKSTGGSSGVPLHFFLDTGSNDRRMAASHRGYAWAGAAPGTRQVYLWGVALGDQTRRQRWKDYLYNRWLYRHHVLNTFDLSEESTPRFLSEFNRFRPDALVAYTNPLYSFARSLQEQGLKPFPPKSIVVGAEKLHDFQRELIQQVFQTPVFETYGSREFMLIGAECERHQGLHLTMEHLVVEIVDDDGNPTLAGEEGNIVITDLFNYGMPFIRYVTGDRAIAGFGGCSCGRGLPLLKKVVGRRLDVLTTPDGRKVPGEFFPHLLKDFDAIRRFQVVQECHEEFEIKLVVDSTWNSEACNQLEYLIRQTVGEEIELKILEVDDIPLTRAGKLQVVVNRCSEDTQALVTTKN